MLLHSHDIIDLLFPRDMTLWTRNVRERYYISTIQQGLSQSKENGVIFEFKSVTDAFLVLLPLWMQLF